MLVTQAFTNSGQNKAFPSSSGAAQRMALIGMDVAKPEPDFVGFAIEVKNPESKDFQPLRNRLNFSYEEPAHQAVDGNKNYPSLVAPFQKFRWTTSLTIPKAESMYIK